MVRIRSVNDITLNIIDFYRTAQTQLDLKPGQVARDLLVDGPAVQISNLYDELYRVQDAQSLAISLGSDLDALASNFGAVRGQGSTSTGTAIVTFNAIDADIPINQGELVIASNGASFSVNTSFTVSVVNKNTYRAVASKYRADLDFVGISDQYAVEVAVTATTTGTTSNIAKYNLNTTTIAGASGVTNAAAFNGGSAPESDTVFKNRLLGIFSGSNTGTSAGYKDIVLSDPEVVDALVVGPGDPLMTRDGTVTVENPDGSYTIVSEGTGGKVDIYAYGFRLVQNVDSYIYYDKSNQNDTTNAANNFVLGQIASDANKTVSKKRVDDIQNGTVPNQPVINIISVSGSLSGSNFVQQTTNSLGVSSGNYTLLKDTGAYAGSPWGFDSLHWTDDHIRDYVENETKGSFNGQDPLGFTDVSSIPSVKQDIQIINENSVVSSTDRTSIQLAHYPVSNVSRVFNQTTGERYVISNQNPDGSGSLNETGRIIISGNTLPAVSDILQVDYIWNYSYDPSFDYDNKVTSDNPRTVTDSIDWGYSNAVRREESIVVTSGSQKVVQVTHPISSVISVNTFTGETATVTLVSDRLAIFVGSLVLNVISIIRNSDGAELFHTNAENGSFSGFTVFLPTDTVAKIGDSVSVRYNASDIFTVSGLSGSFSSNTITISSASTVTAGTIVECNYIANITQIVPTITLPSLPVIKSGNYFTTGTQTIGVQPVTNIYSSNVVQKNLRTAPTHLRLAITGSISPGVITVTGSTVLGIFDGVFVVTSSGLTHNLSTLVKSALGLNSNQSVPSTVSVIKLVTFKKVDTDNNLNVLSTIHTYDINGYYLKDNSYVKSESVADSTLSTTQVKLPSTSGNTANSPIIGDKIQVTFYIVKTSDSENISFGKSGSLYTNKTFSYVDSIAISSGFTSTESQSATITVYPQNQPAQGSRYSATYDYIAPKQNERITINYNNNGVISDNTFAIERARPIGHDVLVKQAIGVSVDATLAVVVTSGSENSSTTIQQNVYDAIVSSLNATQLGTTVDSSDLINTAYTITGVDRVRVIYFNKTGNTGSVLSISANSNQYLQAGSITINMESR